MKRIIRISICLLAVYITGNTNLFSQTGSKYLAGAVPEVNGKVVFSDTLQLPGMTTAQIYDQILIWANANYNTKESRVAYSNKDEAIVANRGKSELLFSSSALSVDRAHVNYQLNIFALENACRIEMRSINYEYNVSHKRTPEKYLAENWITDKEALNGKDKLYRHNGKFRTMTIDLFDDICNSINLTILTKQVDLYTNKDKSILYDRKNQKDIVTAISIPVTKEPDIIEQRPPKTTVLEMQPVQQVAETPAKIEQVATKESTLQGFKQIDAQQIPGNIIKMLTNDWMLVTSGNEAKFNVMTAGWGGLGVFYNKPVAFCFINTAHYTYQLMEANDTYTFSFYTEAYREALQYCGSHSGKDTDKVKGSGLTPITTPSGAKSFSEAWMIIECKKLVAQPLQRDDINSQMYIGEILNVWVK